MLLLFSLESGNSKKPTHLKESTRTKDLFFTLFEFLNSDTYLTYSKAVSFLIVKCHLPQSFFTLGETLRSHAHFL